MLGIGLSTSTHASGSTFHRPYAEEHINFLYNLLFCDNVALFRSTSTDGESDLWKSLLAEQPDLDKLEKIARNENEEGRTRAIAFSRLRAAGKQVPSKQLLGLIVEVPQDKGLDVLAAFSDGGVRYLNQSGKVLIYEAPGHPVELLAKELIVVAQPVVNKLGAWEKERLPPPRRGYVRLTFLASDGLYFGEGPLNAMDKDPMGGPILAKATQLLQQAIASAGK
ncbi:MAG: hypothetical protein JNM76_03350 [Betaproteobacteria bacterium]|nr:hypothetical protein [Betaproteobacteria bacterium]